MELGIYSFAECTPDPHTGHRMSPAQRMHELLEEIELADQVGLDVYGIGEHHRPEYLASAPAVILASAAARTKRIRLTSAVSVLSSDDPVRVFQDFATLDLLSDGRAEIMAGRGSFIESFPLFGLDLDDYESLFAENLELLLKVRASEHVTWSGNHRSALTGQGVYPRPVQDPLPVWVAIGGTPASAVRAGRLGLPLALAILGGRSEQFLPLVQSYREAGQRAGHAASQLKLGVNLHGFIADNSQQAADEAFAPFLQVMNHIGRERGWAPMGRREFDGMRAPGGALFVGSPQEVADKIIAQHAILGHERFLMQLTVGTISHASVMRAIELFGTQVAPVVRKATAPVVT